MRAALEIARVNLLRSVRDRSSLFFIFALPLILIVALGIAAGGGGVPRLGVTLDGEGPLARELVDGLRAGPPPLDVRESDSPEALREAVATRRLEGGLVLPEDYDAAVRQGRSARATLLARPESLMSSVRQVVELAITRQAARIAAARLAEEHAGLAFEDALLRAQATQAALPGVEVRLTTLGSSMFPRDADPFAFGAQSQAVLFMFLTSMTAATHLILTRQLGVSRRMLATPTPVAAILGGELLGRFAVAMMQGLFIVVASTLLFGVAWGDLAAASLVIVLFALIGTGVAMIVGSVARNPEQAGGLGVVLGMVLGALGGAMVPGELFSEPLATISRATPHAWAIDALRDLAFRDAGVADILGPLAVLVAMASVLVALGTWSLRRALTRA